MQLTVTPAQARLVAQHLHALQSTLALLTLGTDAEGRGLANVNVDTGALTFHVKPDAPKLAVESNG